MLSVLRNDCLLRCYRYWGVFWIDASTHDSIQACWTQIALILRVDKDINSVKRALANTSQTWLLVFDNADDPNLSLTPYFPAGDRGDIVITSRNPECHQYNTVGCREIGRLSNEDAEALFLRIAYGDTALNDRFQRDGRGCQDFGSSRVSDRAGGRLHS